MGGSGGAAMGGANPGGGAGADAGGTGGMGGSGGAPGGVIPLGNMPVPSTGCGQPQGITSGFKTINSEGQNREYVIDIPSNYDPNTPYRFFYVSHWANGNAQAMASNNYYGIKTEANADGEPAIFVAPSGIGGFWGEEDHPLFDNILARVEESLCIDTTRVFAIGYSFGGMISYSLSRNHQDKLRAVVAIAPANWNIWMPETTNAPIPWLQVHGLQDETCSWVNSESRREGGKYIVLEKAADNGCDIPGDDDFPVWQSGPHFCYEFEGCNEGSPVKICTNNGTHSGAEKYRDPGEGSSWVPPTAWEFFTRF
jgi:poly(3-hydroxybutyrate) depolymerase